MSQEGQARKQMLWPFLGPGYRRLLRTHCSGQWRYRPEEHKSGQWTRVERNHCFFWKDLWLEEASSNTPHLFDLLSFHYTA